MLPRTPPNPVIPMTDGTGTRDEPFNKTIKQYTTPVE